MGSAERVEQIAAEVHALFLRAALELGWSTRPEVDKPYEELPEAAKGLDRAFARWHLAALAEAEWEKAEWGQRALSFRDDRDSGYEARLRRLRAAEAIVQSQAKDEGLWFAGQTAPEAYLQAALRTLHAAIEGTGILKGRYLSPSELTQVREILVRLRDDHFGEFSDFEVFHKADTALSLLGTGEEPK